MLNNVINSVNSVLTLLPHICKDAEISVSKFFQTSAALQTLETRVVKPFFLYMSKKKPLVYIDRFLLFRESFFPLYRGLSTFDVDCFAEVKPC